MKSKSDLFGNWLFFAEISSLNYRVIRIRNSRDMKTNDNAEMSCPKHSLLILAVFYSRCGKVDQAALHRVLLVVVDVDVRAAHHHVACHPARGLLLQEVQVAAPRNDRTAKEMTKIITIRFNMNK